MPALMSVSVDDDVDDRVMTRATLTLDECRKKLKRARGILGCLESLRPTDAERLIYLEIGCCFKEDEGLSTYVAAKFIDEYFPRGRVYALEMNPDHIRESQAIVEKYQPRLLERIEWIGGSSLQTLPRVLSGIEAVDFAFIDGGAHPATNLFEFVHIWNKLAPHGIVLVDDCSYLKPTPAYPARRDFGKAQLILPFLLMVEHMNTTRIAVAERNSKAATDIDAVMSLFDLPYTTPFTAELYQNAALHRICSGFEDMDFVFCDTQLIVARKPLIAKLRRGAETNRISF